ncbi:MAG: pseudouridine-5-phosphate glycosidase [Nitriliruptorales bacterium]|nr:pseudouridine-5-phosphate glycosidase [Nitriliruptorales bacterium]
MKIAPRVAEALARGAPVVALESTLIAHGLPRPANLDVARELETIIAAEGAVPATVGVVGGVPTVGLDQAELEFIATAETVGKLSVRDLPVAVAAGRDGATTVAGTAHLATRAGVEVFATGGLGGVHRQARDSWDESADLRALSATPVVVVCAGVKSILDVGATLERLETLGITVVGYGTLAFPGFYLTDSGHRLDWRVDTPEEVARIREAQAELGLAAGALIVANPLPPDQQLDPDLHDQVLAEALRQAGAKGIVGKDVTPFLLDTFHGATGGASLECNIRIVRRNARLAAQIAAARSRRA